MHNINQIFFQEIFDFLSENENIEIQLSEDIDKLIKALYTYVIYIDKLYDNEIQNAVFEDRNPLFELTQHYEYCILKLNEIFGNENELIDIKNNYLKIYFDELIDEKKLALEDVDFTYNRFKNLAINKHIPAYFVADCIFKLNNNYPLVQIKEMLSHLFIGIQLYDDVTDLREDLDNNQLTYAISNTIKYLKAENDYHKDNNAYTLKAFYAIEELSNPIFTKMIEEFEKAKEIALQYELSKIQNWIDIIIFQINEWKTQIEQIRNESYS